MDSSGFIFDPGILRPFGAASVWFYSWWRSPALDTNPSGCSVSQTPQRSCFLPGVLSGTIASQEPRGHTS